MKKHLTKLGLMIVVVSFFYFFVLNIFEVPILLERFIFTGAGVVLQNWIKSFQFWGGIGIAAAFLASILWYLLAQWVFPVNNPSSDANRRGLWFLLGLIPLLAVVPAFVFTQQVQAGTWLAYLLYVVNPLLCYYVATVLFSPSAHKYAPLGARVLRRLW